MFFAFSGADTVLFADSDDDGRFDANDFAVRLTGNHGLVRSDFGATDFVTVGTNGNDTINGTEEADRIFGLGGNDIINGLGGADTIDGGIGNDIINGGDGTSTSTVDDNIMGGNGPTFSTAMPATIGSTAATATTSSTAATAATA